MEVNSVNNAPNFGARIVIKKTGFKNLGADLVDSFKSGSQTTGSGASAITETTIFPSDMVKEGSFARNTIGRSLNKMKEALNKIFGRNIKTSELEGVDIKKAASKSLISTSGAGTVSTGLGSYDAALASALDQSVNYPNSIYAKSFPEFSVNHFPESVLNHLNKMEHSAYNALWDPRNGSGNELASTQSTAWSGFGATVQAIGFDILSKSKKGLTETNRKWPS